MARSTVLPDTLPPRLIGRLAAADFVGISPTKFDEMVNDGRMPRPKCIDRRKLWDVRSLNAKVDELPDDEPSKPEREIML
jgi:predicted DNA-binding transcriptional regulator AlpA